MFRFDGVFLRIDRLKVVDELVQYDWKLIEKTSVLTVSFDDLSKLVETVELRAALSPQISHNNRQRSFYLTIISTVPSLWDFDQTPCLSKFNHGLQCNHGLFESFRWVFM